MLNTEHSYWTTEISPTTFSKGLGLKELWQKKYLIWLFVKRDITVQYKQTIFGMGWYFISPLFTMFMYMVVFGKIAGISTDEVPQPVFYLSGICLWEYFSTCLRPSLIPSRRMPTCLERSISRVWYRRCRWWCRSCSVSRCS